MHDGIFANIISAPTTKVLRSSPPGHCWVDVVEHDVLHSSVRKLLLQQERTMQLMQHARDITLWSLRNEERLRCLEAQRSREEEFAKKQMLLRYGYLPGSWQLKTDVFCSHIIWIIHSCILFHGVTDSLEAGYLAAIGLALTFPTCYSPSNILLSSLAFARCYSCGEAWGL